MKRGGRVFYSKSHILIPWFRRDHVRVFMRTKYDYVVIKKLIDVNKNDFKLTYVFDFGLN